MKGKYVKFLSVLLGLVLLLAACGDKSAEKVSEQLSKRLQDLKSYSATAEMVLNTGHDEQKYMIDILYKADNFYRIELKNAMDEQESQIIIKNDEGVFVVTPGQQKSFKFQSDWPENSSQSYLFHSLINDILKDSEGSFEVADDYYVYRVKANYQNNYRLPSQEIFIDKKSLTPILVNVQNNDGEVVVQVRFTDFSFNVDVDDKKFDVEENIAQSMQYVETSGDEAEDIEFEVLYPLKTLGAELADHKEVYFDEGKRIIMVFSGEKNFTLIQEKRTYEQVFSSIHEVEGEMVNLGFGIGAVTDSTVEWNLDGVDYYLASDELTTEELIDIAMSVQGRQIK